MSLSICIRSRLVSFALAFSHIQQEHTQANKRKRLISWEDDNFVLSLWCCLKLYSFVMKDTNSMCHMLSLQTECKYDCGSTTSKKETQKSPFKCSFSHHLFYYVNDKLTNKQASKKRKTTKTTHETRNQCPWSWRRTTKFEQNMNLKTKIR